MKGFYLMSVAAIALAAGTAHAEQTAPEGSVPAAANDGGGQIEDIIVTGRKKAQGELLQNVPIAISALSGDQIENSKSRTLTGLAANIPNVSMDDVGTIKGSAVFSVRGLGLNSSIPTLEPTTGVFYDGIYMGTSQGILIDLFDLDGIEILRGPQGTLFGKNVTGGAVIIRSRAPSDKFEVSARASIESGPQYKAAGSVSGPIAPGLSARLSVLYDKDEGWFENSFDHREYGASRTVLVRPSLRWAPDGDFDTVLRYEHGDIEGDGSAYQNLAFDDRTGFSFSNNYGRGINKLRWDQLTSESNLSVGFGDGVITNIAGYRKLYNNTGADADGTPIDGLHARYKERFKQFSNELRYAGRFGDFVDLTVGAYYFHADLNYFEERRLRPLGFAARGFGGQQKQNTYALFAQGDFDLTDALELTLGARYSIDKKNADIALFSGTTSTCNFDAETCTFDRPDQKGKWNNFTPKIGLQYKVSNAAQLYASATRAYRAGGFNVRVTSPLQNLRFNQERTTAFEVGGKADLFDRRVRTNLAVFYNKIDDLIRDVNVPTGTGAVVQDSRNTADVTIWGLEFETQVQVSRDLRLNGFLGYQHADYKKIRFSLIDLPGEVPGTINAADYALTVPRLVPWSWGVGADYSHEFETGFTASSRISYSRKNSSYASDDNRLKLLSLDTIDASASLTLPNKAVTFTVYGRNLLNSAYQGFLVALPASVVPPVPAGRSPALAAMSEGRTIGIEMSVKF